MRLAHLLVLAPLLFACSGGGGTGIRRDLAGTTDGGGGDSGGGVADMTGVVLDMTGVIVDMAGGTKDMTIPSACSAPSTLGALGSLTGTGEAGQDTSGNDYVTTAFPFGTMQGKIYIELWGGLGVYSNDTSPTTGTVDLSSPDEQAYDTCGACVQLGTNLGSGGVPKDLWMPTSGTLNVTSWTGTLTATLTNVKLRHVIIDPNTFETTPAPSGCTTTITSGSFSAPLM